MAIRRKIGSLAVALGCAVATTLVTGGTAHAGTSGQQLLLINNSHATGSFWLVGYDQNGHQVKKCQSTEGRWETWFSGWWWQGSLYYMTYGSADCTGTDTSWGRTVDIPLSQSNDWQAITDNNYSYGGTSQIDFFDNKHIANSFRITGYNQWDNRVSNCWSSPGWETAASGWWWKIPVTITTYASSDCSGSGNWSEDVSDRVGNPNMQWYGLTD